MGKLFAVFVVSIFVTNTCFALGLELSDVIKEAREIQKAKLLENQTQEKSIQPVKNEVQSNSFDKEKITAKKQLNNNLD